MPLRRSMRMHAARRSVIYASWALICGALALELGPLAVQHVRARDELAWAHVIQLLLAASLVGSCWLAGPGKWLVHR